MMKSMRADIVSQLIINGVLNGFVFSLVSVGLTLIYGVMKVVNFAHGSLMMIGIYHLLVLRVYETGSDNLVSLTTALSAILGVIIYRVVVRKMLGLAKFTQLLSTFGLMVLFTNGASPYSPAIIGS